MFDPYEPWHPDGPDDPDDYPMAMTPVPWIDDPVEFDQPDDELVAHCGAPRA